MFQMFFSIFFLNLPAYHLHAWRDRVGGGVVLGRTLTVSELASKGAGKAAGSLTHQVREPLKSRYRAVREPLEDGRRPEAVLLQ